ERDAELGGVGVQIGCIESLGALRCRMERVSEEDSLFGRSRRVGGVASAVSVTGGEIACGVVRAARDLCLEYRCPAETRARLQFAEYRTHRRVRDRGVVVVPGG